MKLAASLLLLVSLALGLRGAQAAPLPLTDRPIDLELREADVKNVLTMMGEASGRPVMIDPCVKGTVDLRLTNVPVSLVLDALALKLALHWAVTERGIEVTCAGATPAQSEKLATRVSIAETDAPLPDVLGKLATAAGLAGVDYHAGAKPKITMTLERVQLGTVLAALAEGTGLRISVEKDRLVAVD